MARPMRRVGFALLLALAVSVVLLLAPKDSPSVTADAPASNVHGTTVDDILTTRAPVRTAERTGIAIKNSTELVLQVISSHDGSIIMDALVSSEQHHIERSKAGEFLLQYEPREGGSIRVTAQGYIQQELAIEELLARARGAPQLQIALRALASLNVRVIDELGRPVPGVSIDVSRHKDQRDSAVVGNTASRPFKTGVIPELLGICHIPSLPCCEQLWLAAYGPCLRTVASVRLEPHGETQLDLIVALGATLSGQLIDSTGTGVEGVSVALHQAPAEHQPVNKKARTNSSGNFLMESVVPGDGTLHFSTRSLPVTVHPGHNELDPIQLAGLRKVSINLISSLPVEYRYLRVQVRDASNQLLTVRFSPSSKHLLELPPEDLFVDVSYVRDEGGGYQQFLCRELLGRTASHLEVQLDQWLASLEVSPQGRSNLEGAHFEFYELPGGLEQHCSSAEVEVRRSILSFPPQRLPTGGIGAVLPAGKYDCLVSTDDGSQVFTGLHLSAGKTAALVLDDPQLCTLSGLVVDDKSAEPIAGITVNLLQSGQIRSVVASGDGRFSFADVRLGPFRIAAETRPREFSGSVGDCMRGGSASVEVVVRAKRLGSLAGTVTDAADRKQVGRVGLRQMVEGASIRYAPLVDGSFEFAAVQAGLHLVSYGPEGRLVLVEDGVRHTVDLTVGAVATATVEVLGAARPEGAVFVEEGPDAWVRPVSPDADGIFSLHSGPTGGWLLLSYGHALRAQEYSELVRVPGPGHHRLSPPTRRILVRSDRGLVPPEMYLVELPGGQDVPLVGGTPRVRLLSGNLGIWEYGGITAGARYELRGLDQNGDWASRTFTVSNGDAVAVDW